MVVQCVKDMLNQIVLTGNVDKVFGASREIAGKTVIPVARVAYGGGGGGGEAKNASGESETTTPLGSGGGMGMGAKIQPFGCVVIDEKGERWLPIIDVTRIAIGGCILGCVAFWTLRSIVSRQR